MRPHLLIHLKKKKQNKALKTFLFVIHRSNNLKTHTCWLHNAKKCLFFTLITHTLTIVVVFLRNSIGPLTFNAHRMTSITFCQNAKLKVFGDGGSVLKYKKNVRVELAMSYRSFWHPRLIARWEKMKVNEKNGHGMTSSLFI